MSMAVVAANVAQRTRAMRAGPAASCATSTTQTMAEAAAAIDIQATGIIKVRGKGAGWCGFIRPFWPPR